MPSVAFVSFRLGTPDGVSVAAATWMRAFTDLGWEVASVAGEGNADVIVPWLAIDSQDEPEPVDVKAAVGDADLVVAENVLTIPINLAASLAVADALRGRPALLHHHDPPWQRERFDHVAELPLDDPAWRHVAINRHTSRELADRGFPATSIYNGFDLGPPTGDRTRTRARLGLVDGDVLLLHPVRAIARKNVPCALALAEALGATYWLPGPAEEGYGPELDRLLRGTTTRVVRTPLGPDPSDAYAACDAVLLPSHWEGFGNPAMEAAPHLKPVVVGHYPVADELRALGFRWLEPDDPGTLARAIAAPDHQALATNLALARAHCSYEALRANLAALLDQPGWWR